MLQLTVSSDTALEAQPQIHLHFDDNVPRAWPEGFFTAKRGEIVVLPQAKLAAVQVHVGLGKRDRLTQQIVRQIFRAISRRCSAFTERLWHINWTLPVDFFSSASLGLADGLYKYLEFAPTQEARPPRAIEFVFHVAPEQVQTLREEARLAVAVGQGVEFARDLANAPGNALPPLELARRIQAKFKSISSVSVEVLGVEKLRAMGMRGVLAVGGGSANAPCMILIKYSPSTRKRGKTSVKKPAPLALVGKAVTFDSGGISIKPAENMEEMKYDKAGGCAVAGALWAVAKMGLKSEIVGVIPAAENLPSHSSYRPGDVVRCYDDTTVEVVNTDAEGRIILADALAYTVKRFRPQVVVDLATLTGACVVALGTSRAGLFSNHDKIAEKIIRAADVCGEPVWSLPHDESHHEQIESKVAKIKNSGGRWGGACTGAAFLEHFIPQGQAWAHLDIAGVAWNSTDTSLKPYGATGYGVALLVYYVAGLSETH